MTVWFYAIHKVIQNGRFLLHDTVNYMNWDLDLVKL